MLPGYRLTLPTGNRLEPIIERVRAEFGQNSQQDDGNTWRFEVLTDGGRSHVVTLFLKHAIMNGRDLSRLIAYAPIGPVSTTLNYELVLRKNCELDVGAIAIEDVWTRDNVRLPFVVFRATHLAVSADFQEVWELIMKTGEYADQLEKVIYAKDQY